MELWRSGGECRKFSADSGLVGNWLDFGGGGCRCVV